MPSFDIVSEVNMHEVTNAIDQSNREIGNRFDFKTANARFELDGDTVILSAEAEFHLKQMIDILQTKLSRRKVDLGCLAFGQIETVGKLARQVVTIRQGLESELTKQITKEVKGLKLKIQPAIQGEKVRISGKKKNDLQEVIAYLKGQEYDMPLQFTNYRD